MTLITCPCCHEHNLQTRIDAKSRPYLTCGSCSVRIFPRGLNSIVGLRLMSPLVDALAERIRTDRTEWEHAQEVRRSVELELLGKSAAPAAATSAADLVATAQEVAR
jgi:hypothetical protein